MGVRPGYGPEHVSVVKKGLPKCPCVAAQCKAVALSLKVALFGDAPD